MEWQTSGITRLRADAPQLAAGSFTLSGRSPCPDVTPSVRASPDFDSLSNPVFSLAVQMFYRNHPSETFSFSYFYSGSFIFWSGSDQVNLFGSSFRRFRNATFIAAHAPETLPHLMQDPAYLRLGVGRGDGLGRGRAGNVDACGGRDGLAAEGGGEVTMTSS